MEHLKGLKRTIRSLLVNPEPETPMQSNYHRISCHETFDLQLAIPSTDFTIEQKPPQV